MLKDSGINFKYITETVSSAIGLGTFSSSTTSDLVVQPSTSNFNSVICFGPYKLGKTIGRGEFGKVKIGYHQETGKEVAIKFIKKISVDSVMRKTKLAREISILQSISHSSIVQLDEVIETEGYIGLILEYASGGELFEYILTRGLLSEQESGRIFSQLIDAVAYLHSCGIIHRDLKLENILLDRFRNLKVTDFGFANIIDYSSQTMLKTSCGSPCYAAPELVANPVSSFEFDQYSQEYNGELADIWSCGVILYAMLCGTLPFDDDPNNYNSENLVVLYKYIMDTKLKFPVILSMDAVDLISRILETNPVKRARMDEIKRHRWLSSYTNLFKTYLPRVGESNVLDINSVLQEGLAPQREVSLPIDIPQRIVPDLYKDDQDSVKAEPIEKSPLLFKNSPSHEILNSAILNDPECFLLKENNLEFALNGSGTGEILAKDVEFAEKHEQDFITEGVSPSPILKDPSFNDHHPLARKSTVSFVFVEKPTSLIEDPPVSVESLLDDDVDHPVLEIKQDELEHIRRGTDSVTSSDSLEERNSINEIEKGGPAKSRFSLNLIQPKSDFIDQRNRAQSMDARRKKKIENAVYKEIGNHSGPIDQRAITVYNPVILMDRIRLLLSRMGFEYRVSPRNPFKLIVQKNPVISRPSIDVSRVTSESTRISMQSTRSYVKKKRNPIVSSFSSVFEKIRLISLFGFQYNRGYDGSTLLPPVKNKSRADGAAVEFHIVIHKLPSIEGVWIVDMKRRFGCIWHFKELYNEIIVALDLKAKGQFF